MAHCRYCDVNVDVEDLVRHETDGFVRVHCPECSGLLGTYRDPSQKPPRP